MTHYWLTDRTDGLKYIHNPGYPDHGSCSLDGVNWDRPVDDAHLSRRQIIMDRIMAEERDLKAKAGRERERERQEQNLKTIKAMRKELSRNTLSENMVAVLGCALFAVCLAGGATFVVHCIDVIIKTVRAW